MVASAWITREEAASRLGVSERTVRTYISAGLLRKDAEIINDRPRVVVRAADVDNLLRDREAAQ